MQPNEAWLDLDVLRLIQAVKPHKILWDGTSAPHHDRIVKWKLWQEIFKLFESKFSSDAIRRKWSYLRTHYSRTAKKHNFAFGPSTWKYYEAMSFIPTIDMRYTPYSELPETRQVSTLP